MQFAIYNTLEASTQLSRENIYSFTHLTSTCRYHCIVATFVGIKHSITSLNTLTCPLWNAEKPNHLISLSHFNPPLHSLPVTDPRTQRLRRPPSEPTYTKQLSRHPQPLPPSSSSRPSRPHSFPSSPLSFHLPPSPSLPSCPRESSRNASPAC